MNKQRRRRLWHIILFLLVLVIAAALVLYALRQNINLFYAPTDIKTGKAPIGQVIRLGGMVEAGSIEKNGANLETRFVVTDYQNKIAVVTHGVLPALFREGQGVVATGTLVDRNNFNASEILARHDENYMPPQVRATLKEKT